MRTAAYLSSAGAQALQQAANAHLAWGPRRGPAGAKASASASDSGVLRVPSDVPEEESEEARWSRESETREAESLQESSERRLAQLSLDARI